MSPPLNDPINVKTRAYCARTQCNSYKTPDKYSLRGDVAGWSTTLSEGLLLYDYYYVYYSMLLHSPLYIILYYAKMAMSVCVASVLHIVHLYERAHVACRCQDIIIHSLSKQTRVEHDSTLHCEFSFEFISLRKLCRENPRRMKDSGGSSRRGVGARGVRKIAFKPIAERYDERIRGDTDNNRLDGAGGMGGGLPALFCLRQLPSALPGVSFHNMTPRTFAHVLGL